MATARLSFAPCPLSMYLHLIALLFLALPLLRSLACCCLAAKMEMFFVDTKPLTLAPAPNTQKTPKKKAKPVDAKSRSLPV